MPLRIVAHNDVRKLVRGRMSALFLYPTVQLGQIVVSSDEFAVFQRSLN